MKLPEHVSESVKRRNPELYGGAPVAGLPDPKRESDQRGKSQNRQPQKSQEGFRYRITIISLRSRLVDAHDNLRTGAKSLVDIITRSIGFDNDADPRLEWCYHQIIGKPNGTIALIERYNEKTNEH